MPPSATKTCPTCQQPWAATFKFCPEDGSALIEPAQSGPRPDMPATRPKSRSSRLLDVPPVTASETAPSAPAAPRVAAVAAPAPEAAPRETTRRQTRPNARAETPPERPQQRVVKGGAAAARVTSRQDVSTSPERKAYNLRTAPTLLLTPAISEEVAQAALARAEQKASQPRAEQRPSPSRGEDQKATQVTLPRAEPTKAPRAEPTNAPAKAEGKRKKGGFSETDWFLAPIDPNDVDAKTGKVLVDPAKYERNTAIPDEKRRRFSLRRDDEE